MSKHLFQQFVLGLTLLSTAILVGCNGASNSQVADGSMGLVLKVERGDDQIVTAGKSPEILPVVQVTTEDGTPAAGLELIVKSHTAEKPTILASSVTTDATGKANISFTAPASQAVDFDVTISSPVSSIELTLHYSTPDSSPTTKFVLATTKGTNIVAGELFGFVVSLVNEDESIFKYNGTITLLWQYTISDSWTGVKPKLPLNSNFPCTFVDGVCQTDEIYFLTDARQTQLISTGDGDAVIPGRQNYIDAFAIEITVLPNVPYKYTAADKFGGPIEGAVAYSPLQKIKVTADFDPKDYFGAVIDKVGNFLNDAPSGIIWSSPHANINSAIGVNAGVNSSITFTPGLVADSVMNLTDPDGVVGVGSVPIVVRAGAPKKISVTTQNSNNTFLAGTEVLPTLKLVDAKGNVCSQVTDYVEFNVTSPAFTGAFGPAGGGGGLVTLGGGPVSGAYGTGVGGGWDGRSFAIQPHVTLGQLGQGALRFTFKDARYKPSLSFSSTKRIFAVPVDPELYPDGLLTMPAGYADLASDPLQLTVTTSGIPSRYILHTEVPDGENEIEWYSDRFYNPNNSSTVQNTLPLFQRASDIGAAPVISTQGDIDPFEVFMFYIDTTNNIIFDVATPGLKPNCDTSNIANLTDPEDTPLCAGVAGTFAVSDGDHLYPADGRFGVSGSDGNGNFSNFMVNPLIAGVGTGWITVTDPNYPTSSGVTGHNPARTYTQIKYEITPGDLHHFKIFAKTCDACAANSVDASVTYDLYVRAYDEKDNWISSLSSSINDVKILINGVQLTSGNSGVNPSPKTPTPTQPILPSNKTQIQFSSGQYKMTGLRLPKANDTLANISLTAEAGEYESDVISVSSYPGAIASLRLLNWDPLNPPGVLPTEIDYGTTDIVVTADDDDVIYVVGYDSERNPTNNGFSNLNTGIVRSGSFFGTSMSSSHSISNNLNVSNINYRQASATPYTGLVEYYKPSQITPTASVTLKGITVLPGVESRYDVSVSLPIPQSNNFPSHPQQLIAGQTAGTAPNTTPSFRVCIEDEDSNTLTGYNGSKDLTFVWKNTGGQTLASNRYVSPANGTKNFYNGCMLQTGAGTDVDVQFMLYEAGVANRVYVSDGGALTDGIGTMQVIPNTPYRLDYQITGTAIVGQEKLVTINVLDKYDNLVDDSTIPLTVTLTSVLNNQEITNATGMTSINPSGMALGGTKDQTFSSNVIDGTGNFKIYATQTGYLNFTASTTAQRSVADGGPGLVFAANGNADMKPDVPVALQWNPNVGPLDVYATSVFGWPTLIAELIDQFGNIVTTNSAQPVVLTVEDDPGEDPHSNTFTPGSTLTRNTNYGQSLFTGLVFLQPDYIRLRATHTATGFNTIKDIEIVQSNPNEIILMRNTQTLNEGVVSYGASVSGSIGSPFAVNHDNSAGLTYTFKAYIVDLTYNKVPGWGGYFTPVPDDADAVILDGNDNVLAPGTTVGFDATGTATFKVRFRTAGTSQKIALNCHGFVGSNLCHSSDNFDVTPGPVKYFVPVMAGQVLSDPGKSTLATAVPLAASIQVASVAHQVKIYATDNYYNQVNNSNGNFTNLNLTMSDNESTLSSDGGNFNLTNGYGTVNVTNYHAAAGKTVVVSSAPPSGSAVTSATYTVNPGIAAKLIMLHANQTHVSGVASYATAVAGSAPTLSACATTTLTFKAVDARYNTVTTDTTGLSFTTQDASDDEAAYSGSFVGGVKAFTTVMPVRMGSNYTITPSSVAGYTVETPTTYSVSANSSKKLLVRLNGQGFTSGVINYSNAITGSILATPIAGTSPTANTGHSVTVYGTDICHNLLTTASDSIAIATSDVNDAAVANQALINGSVTFTVYNTTAGSSHTLTASHASYTSGTSATYTVVPNLPNKILAISSTGQVYVPGVTAEASSITGAIPNRTVDTDYTMNLKITDAWHNTVTDPTYDGTSISVTTSDANDTHPSAVTTSAGVATMTLNHKTANAVTSNTTVTSQVHTATFTATGGVSDSVTTSNFTVLPGSAIKAVSLVPGQSLVTGKSSEAQAIAGTGSIANPLTTAGANFTSYMYAVDSYHNVVNTHTGAITKLSTSDANDTDPTSPAAFTAGVATFTVMNTTRANGVTVTPVTALATNRVSDPYNINHGTATKAIALLPNQTLNQGNLNTPRTNETANSHSIGIETAFNVKVYITDNYFNIIQNDVSRTVTISTSSDPFWAVSPSAAQTASGVADYTYAVTNNKSGANQFIDIATNPNLSTKISTPNYTVTPGAATQVIAVFPNQSHNQGAANLAAAVTTAASNAVACQDIQASPSNYNVVFRAVDARFNTITSYGGALGIDTNEGGNPKTSFTSQTFSSGAKTINILPTRVGTHTLSFVDTGSLTTPQSTFNYTVVSGAASKVVSILTGETLTQGNRTLAMTGTITNPVAGTPYTVTAQATDVCFNNVTSTANVTLATADPWDGAIAPLALSGGSRAFSITHTTATSSFPQNSISQHVITTTPTGLTGVSSSNYTVNTGARTRHVILMPGETYAKQGNTNVRGSNITGSPTTQVKGTQFGLTVFATDDYYNKILTDTSALTLTSNDGAAVITPSGATAFVNPTGAKSFTVTNNTVQNLSPFSILTSTDGAAGTFTNTYSVNDTPPTSLSYPGIITALTKGADYSVGWTPTNSGGVITAYTKTNGVNTTLPAGMSLDATTGRIYGSPTTLNATNNAVTVTGSNNLGVNSTTVVVNFTVKDVPPTSLSYSGGAYPNYTFEAGTAITNLTPSPSGGGPIITYTASGTALTGSGLVYGGAPGAGVISGTPTNSTASPVSYNGVISTATNTGGSANTTLNFTINPQRPTNFGWVTAAPTYVVGTTITTNLISGYVGSAGTTYALQSGTVPNGLTVNSDGSISGTPTTVDDQTITVRATNFSGSLDKTIRIIVNPAAPTSLTYSNTTANAATFTRGSTPTLTPSNGGGPPYATGGYTLIGGTIPAGMTLNADTGVITGTPTGSAGASTAVVYSPQIRISNVTGNTSVTLTLTVNPIAPTALSYTNLTPTYTVGTAITNNDESHTGDSATFTISPSLPQGLSISSSTGRISGTPKMAIDSTTYTVTATNAANLTTRTIEIIINLANTANLTAWWRAVDNSAVGSGQPVNNWASTLNGYSLAKGATAPTYGTAPNKVTFAATTMAMNTDVISGDSNKTIIVAYKATTFSATNPIISFGADTNNGDSVAHSLALTTNGTVITQDQTFNTTSALAAEGIASLVFASGAGQKLSNLGIWHNGTSKAHNGSSSIAIDFSGSFTSLGGYLTIDGSTLSTNKFTGSILEVLIYDTNLSDTDRRLAECHLYWKYSGIPAQSGACSP